MNFRVPGWTTRRALAEKRKAGQSPSAYDRFALAVHSGAATAGELTLKLAEWSLVIGSMKYLALKTGLFELQLANAALGIGLLGYLANLLVAPIYRMNRSLSLGALAKYLLAGALGLLATIVLVSLAYQVASVFAENQ